MKGVTKQTLIMASVWILIGAAVIVAIVAVLASTGKFDIEGFSLFNVWESLADLISIKLGG